LDDLFASLGAGRAWNAAAEEARPNGPALADGLDALSPELAPGLALASVLGLGGWGGLMRAEREPAGLPASPVGPGATTRRRPNRFS
jgi:hypothetical protein